MKCILYSKASKTIKVGWVKEILEEFWTTFDINHISYPAYPNDGIFNEEARGKLKEILKKVKGAKLMKIKDGLLGLRGHKYFLWKDWGPLAWWDFVENNDKVRFTIDRIVFKLSM